MEPSENIEEYLETLWIFEENGVALARISEIAQRLSISRPSAVEMLKKLEERGYVAYKEREGVRLTKRGRKAAEQVIRNHRLVELLIKNTLNAEIDEKVVCGIEHHMTEEFANTLCKSLNHPRQCPHGNEIPRGKCCK